MTTTTTRATACRWEVRASDGRLIARTPRADDAVRLARPVDLANSARELAERKPSRNRANDLLELCRIMPDLHENTGRADR